MGCTQNYLAPRYTFTATFLDAFTSQPIEGIGIASVDAVYSGKGIFSGGRVSLKRYGSYSDKDGLISVPFHRYEKAERYEFIFYSRDNKYFIPGNENIQANVYDSNRDIKKTYKLDSKAQLRVKVNLKTPLKDGEKIDLIIGSKYEINITNNYVNDNKTYELTGNFPTSVTKIYINNGVETRVRETITLKPFVVNDYEFTY